MPKKERRAAVAHLQGMTREPVPENSFILESYWITEPHAKAVIAIAPGAFGPKYFLLEPPLSQAGYEALSRFSEVIEAELNPRDFDEVEDLKKAVTRYIDKLFKKYSGIVKLLSQEERGALRYYLERNFIGFGYITPLLDDANIEDISCDGVNMPIYVWHRRYESIPTNLIFTDKKALDDYLVSLAHRAGKHVSAAFPIVDAMLAGQHRLAATYKEEVSPSGSTFTIRKFRSEPFSIIDQISMGTLSVDIAAYIWLLMDYKFSFMVIGGTGAGKTSLLNSLCNFIKPSYKVVTVEEVQELNIPLQNWVRLVTRETYGALGTAATNISLYELVKTSLRYRPDYLIVGEVRGQEAYVLFQALATGHGGLSTMHAESLDSVVKRLISPPMNISPAYIPLMNVVILIERVTLPLRGGEMLIPARRVRNLWEILEYENYYSLSDWVQRDDRFVSDFSASSHLRRLAVRMGKTYREVLAELEKRRIVLEWLLERGVRRIWEVSGVIAEYSTSPDRVFERATSELSQLRREPKAAEGAAVEELLIGLLEEMGGRVNLNTLLAASRLDEKAFWDTLSSLIGQGAIDLRQDGQLELKARRTA